MKTAPLAAWALIGLPVAALGLPIVVYLPPFYSGTLGLPLATVGFLFALVRIIDIPLDPLFGTLMDNSRSRIGQFRPWVLAGSLFLMAGTWMLFMAEPGVTAWMTFLALFTLYLGFSMVNLAQVSWGSRLSADYGERARIFGWWTAVNVIGTMAVLFVPPIVGALDPAATPGDGIRAMGWSIIVVIPLVVLLAALTVPEGEAPVGSHRVSLLDVRQLLRDPRMVRLLLVDLFLSMAGGLTGALFLFFFTAARGLAPATASQLLLCYFVAGLVAAPLWVRLAQRQGKHRATAAASVVVALSLLFVVLVPAQPLWIPAVAMALAGLPFAAPAFLLRAMMADLNDAQALDRRRGGGREPETTGLNFAILTATQKLGYAIPVGLTYPILGAIGFDPRPGAANSAGAIQGLELLFVGPPVLLGALAAIIVWRWPITAEAHALIRSALAARPLAGDLPPPEPAPPGAPLGGQAS